MQLISCPVVPGSSVFLIKAAPPPPPGGGKNTMHKTRIKIFLP